MDYMSEDLTAANRRIDPRIAMDEPVTVRVDATEIVGPGQNISAQGLFFVTETTITVKVRIGDEDQVLDGQLIRVQAMGDGRYGIAVRFREPAPPYLLPDDE